MIRTGTLIFIFSLFAFTGASQSTHIRISTNLGEMTFMLYDDTPGHRDAFLKLAGEGYYDETLFFRVIRDFLIQGGSKSSRNAPPGTRIGFGDPSKTIGHEILPHHFHKKGALCAPRQPDEVNPEKRSDISQFFIVKGRIYTPGELDTMELIVNRPVRNSMVKKYLNDEVRARLQQLREEKRVEEFREIAGEVRRQIDQEYNGHPDLLVFSEAQREAYTTAGGYPELDGEYTIFGQCTSGFEVIDRIAVLETDENNRPLTDVKITVDVLSK
jgi:cyclophilin family peptidyl-prolyl cis-trans isomerase